MTPAQTKYALTHQNGSVTILSAIDAYGDTGLKQFIAAQRENPVVSVAKIDPPAVPDMRDAYRDALTFDGKSFGHDMAKARAKHRDLIRAARKPLLEAQDVAFSRAQGRGDADAAKAAEAERQRLRDAPQDARIAAAGTIGDLRTVWPL